MSLAGMMTISSLVIAMIAQNFNAMIAKIKSIVVGVALMGERFLTPSYKALKPIMDVTWIRDESSGVRVPRSPFPK
jgi:hypothetical protein